MSEFVVLALGSNLGDRAYELRRAIHRLRGSVRLTGISSVIETDPVDSPKGAGRFLNQVVTGTTELGPYALLEQIVAIEGERQRVRRERNAPRRIDIDIILFGARRQRSEGLTIPHPRFRDRDFVTIPMRELVPASWMR